MKFSIRRNKDASTAFEASLLEAGHEYTKRPAEADILLFDSESVGWRREQLKELLEDRPGFIYPHTPQTCWLWDGVYDALPVDCNFVYAPNHKKAMEQYGYPYPIEVVGFPRCKIKPFSPTGGKNLLFVPARPRNDGGRHAKLDLMAFHWIIEHYHAYFETVTICRIAGQFQDEFDRMCLNWERMKDIITDPRSSSNPALDMVRRIDDADVVISTNTPAVLSVARGVPTIFYGESEVPDTIMGRQPASYEKYRHLLQFPLTLEDMRIEDVFDTCQNPNPEVEEWKRLNIGEPFDKNKFVEVVERCLRTV